MRMPDIIDTKNVGAYIKKLLRDNGMTQEELSRQLNISKSAVSQNLNGKSAFDIQNLMRIAKIFDVSLDQLLHQKTRESNDTMSEYERIIVHDQTKIDHIDSSQLKDPDLYGKFLIEYVMEHDEKDLFENLYKRGMPLVDKGHSRYGSVISRMMLYALEKSVGDVTPLIHAKIEHEGAFDFRDQKVEQAFYTLVERESTEAIRKHLLTGSVTVQNKLFGKIPFNQSVKILPKRKALEIIFKYDLRQCFKTMLQHFKGVYDFELIVELAVRNRRKVLLERYLDSVDPEQVERIDFSMRPVDDALLKLKEFQDTELFLKAFSKGFHDNPDDLFEKLVESGDAKIYDHLLNTGRDAFNMRKVAVIAVRYKDYGLIKQICEDADQKTLNLMLAESDPDDVKMVKHLIRSGALFDINHYRRNTYDKINTLVTHLLKGDDAS